MLLSLPVFKKTCAYDVTIFQTPRYGEKRDTGSSIGQSLADNHQDALERAFSVLMCLIRSQTTIKPDS